MTRITLALSCLVILIVLGLIPNPIIPGMAPCALADSFNVKPGAWEMTHTTLTTGLLIPPDVLAKMPPEQRARLEQSMQARAGKPTTHVSKECVTQEDLDQNRMIKEEHHDEDGVQCTTKVVSKSSSKLVIERTCAAPRASTTQLAVEAKTPESIVGSIIIARRESGKVHVDIKGRWLGASCAEIKDRD